MKKLWHKNTEEPKNKEHCLINFGGEEYKDFELVFYDKGEGFFLTAPYPHHTNMYVEDRGTEGAAKAEIYKIKRDRIPLSDIVKWCSLEDLSNKE